MYIISSKWGIAIIGIIAILLLLFLLGRKSVQTSVFVAAKPQKVWSVLTSTSTAKDWNTVLVPVDGSLIPGTQIDYEFYEVPGEKPSKIKASVNQVILDSLINQSGGIPGILTFDHYYILHNADTGTVVEIKEAYQGIMVPFWSPHGVEKAYARLLEALKQHVQEETGQSKPNPFQFKQ